jgi:hypothetical protein
MAIPLLTDHPLCDDADCLAQSTQAFEDVELVPPGAALPINVGTLRFCTRHARRFVIEGRVNVAWDKLLPKA